MTLNSSRLLIAQGLQTMLQGVTNPATSLPVYQQVQLGAFFNPEVYASWAEVAFFEGKSGPAGSGGNLVGWRVDDAVTFSVVSGWDYEEDSTAAMTNMLTAMDIVLPLLHSHVVIPLSTNPAVGIASVYSVLEEQPDRAIPVRIPNGHVYLLWHVYVVVRQQYNVTLTSP
jgi:hypothetical protein